MAKLLWTQKQDIGPSPRFGHAMAFDAARGRVVLFGGATFDANRLGDTWIWDGEDWTQVEDIGPVARAGHAMAYDSARQRVVLFGGSTGAALLADTWEWDGDAWTQMQDSGPAAREQHAMAVDMTRGQVLLFGGGGPGAALFRDTWAWDGSDWSQQDDGGPSARRGHGMTSDVARSRVVLFGGVDAAGPGGLADTWEWDGNLWKQVADMGPDGCVGGVLVFRTSRTALFGGASSAAAAPDRRLFGLTWEWDGSHWTARQDIGVGARTGHAMAFDAARSRVVLFGGLQGFVEDADPAQLRGDTWEHPDLTSAPVGGGQPIASVDAGPNPVQPGQDLIITPSLAGPAGAGGQTVTLESNAGPLGDVVIDAGQTSSSIVLPLAPDIGSFIPLPFVLEITASTTDGSSATTSVTIEPI